MTFQSSWQAEVAARQLAKTLADCGVRCEIQLFIRTGELVGLLLCGPNEPLLH